VRGRVVFLFGGLLFPDCTVLEHAVLEANTEVGVSLLARRGGWT
jgi:hypothetical protein